MQSASLGVTTANAGPSAPPSLDTATPSKLPCFMQAFNITPAAQRATTTPTSITKEFEVYAKCSHDSAGCPSAFWAQHKHVRNSFIERRYHITALQVYPLLATLADMLLCVPSSSAACEHVFSATSILVDGRRGGTCPKTLHQRTIVYGNSDLA